MRIWIRICYIPIELGGTEQKTYTQWEIYRLCGVACEAHASKSAQCLRPRWYVGNLKLLARIGGKGEIDYIAFFYLGKYLCARWERKWKMCY